MTVDPLHTEQACSVTLGGAGVQVSSAPSLAALDLPALGGLVSPSAVTVGFGFWSLCLPFFGLIPPRSCPSLCVLCLCQWGESTGGSGVKVLLFFPYVTVLFWARAGGDGLSGALCFEPRLSGLGDSGTLFTAEARSLGFSGTVLKVF